MGDHQKCHVKIPICRKQSSAIQKVIPDIGVVHNNNFYISEDTVLKHTSTKLDLRIYQYLHEWVGYVKQKYTVFLNLSIK